MKTIRSIKFAGILATAMLLGTQLRAQDKSEQLTVALSEPGKPYKLNVDLVQGSITVTGYEGKDVIIEVKSEERRHQDREVNGMKRLDPGASADIHAEEKNNTVTVGADIPHRVNLLIKVPQNGATLKLSTVNGGNLTVNNVSGDMELSNTNGGIKMSGISGSVVANTTNGPVNVAFKSIDPKAAMAFTTLNGSVDITFPANLKANIKLKTDHGNIYTDFDVVNDARKPEITRTAKDGMYNLKIDDWVYGKIAGGGPEILMKTMNGSIYLRKVK
ncbi:hypothetical protein BEL04_07180 [Mucilaginibacter sp. PPCGB 2223]|uniref:DUF4097 family beta strand repeat-containing protein n=1 Tax=Mucilaginibacter sp. PPCGB 2223 TaxID=1886027 RepID=UPI0008250C46|nr:DUF4097 family beta strand repeat-containing protein [Mucilaginibacter sp. PPCGB 2223]OCX54050.1 hypothetical protein BEL04_07180 [Mucilaginibacter sp. PPCGB 2223]